MDKPRLFISPRVRNERNITVEYIDHLRAKFEVGDIESEDISKEEFLAHVQGKNALLVSTFDIIDEEVIRAAGEDLKVIAVAAVGFDRIDLNVLKRNGIQLGSSGSAITEAAAEMAVTLLLATSRKLVPFVNCYKNDPVRGYQPKNVCRGLQKSIVGIAGAGRVGTSVARKLAQFELAQLLYFNLNENEAMKKLGGKKVSLEELAKKSDYIIVTLVYNKETHHIINEKIFSLMKPTAYIVNIGRGGLIDHEALVDALRRGRISGAGLDVTEPEPLPEGHPLLEMDEVVLSPHVGGLTTITQQDSVTMAIQNITAALQGRQMPGEIKL